MMNSATLRLVLLVSACHALVHVYEHTFATVEQLVAEEFGVGTAATGIMGTCLALPFGLFAFAAGWLADRLGAKRLLLVYLFGCSGAALLAWLSPSLGLLGVAMFTLGTFAAIYHPAGVGLISHHTHPENRPMALGYHGIFGSVGIAAGPFLAAGALAAGASWRQYYLILTVPGVILAVLLMARLSHDQSQSTSADPQNPATHHDEDLARWGSYFMLISSAMLAGFVYRAVLTFLPRYLDEAGVHFGDLEAKSIRNILTGFVLLLGVIGQYTAGRIARPKTLEPLLAVAFISTAPCLVWMGFAQGYWRVAAAALFAPLFFMHQPLFNSLVAKYVPRRRRSLGYGLSFTLGFGVGSLGSTVAGRIETQWINYGLLAVLITLAATLGATLWRINRRDGLPEPPPPLTHADAP
jgi:MFS family permease